MTSNKKNKSIQLWGVEQNNLKNIDVEIPLNSFTVICGPSGSGKSSLAFETLYAEGQRRYIEGMSNYTKQFLDKSPKPKVEQVENIPPAIAIEQKNAVKSSRSTVGTHTEVLDYLRLLFSKIGKPYCPKHRISLTRHSVHQATEHCLDFLSDQRGYVLSPIYKEHRTLEGKKLLSQLLKEGFLRIYVPSNKSKNKSSHKIQDFSAPLQVEMGEVIDLHSEKILKKGKLSPLFQENFYIVIDRLSFDKENADRIKDSIEQSYLTCKKFNSAEIQGLCHVLSTEGQLLKFSQELSCSVCHHTSPPLSANLFSFNSPLGACSHCKGFGNTMELSEEKIIPRKDLSIAEGVIVPFAMPSAKRDFKKLLKFCDENKIDVDTPWEKLKAKERDLIWQGNKSFYGVTGLFKYLEKKKYKMHVRVFLARFKSPTTCPVCNGQRLKKETQFIFIQRKNINQLCAMTIEKLHGFITSLKLSRQEQEASQEIIRQIKNRLEFLIQVGVHYLTIDRETKTLSGGEFQRLNLAKQLGMGLSQSLYVLDEPTIGLHPRDNDKLIGLLQNLRNLGNTLVIVEHDQSVIEDSSHIIEMGPESGLRGGEIMFSGTKEDFYKCSNSKTLPFLLRQDNSLFRRQLQEVHLNKHKTVLKLENCTGNNLQGVDLEVPLGRFVCITGVSGSGKSTLISHTLFPALSKELLKEPKPGHAYEKLSGLDSLKNVVLIDQSPISKTVRSQPVSYLKVFDAIRKIFSNTLESKNRGYTPGTFSLNVDGGRCPLCKGLGFEEIDMIFMDNISIPCEACDGKKYRDEVLEIKWEGLNIYEVLNLTVDEAIQFFVSHPEIRKPLSMLKEVGLNYLKLGQSISSLSGGETQRLKIAKELNQNKIKSTLYIMDEPTTGLHFREVAQLIAVIDKLILNGASVILIEHNMDIISCADYIVDLGPEAGQKGGTIVAQGSQKEIMACRKSLTGQYLKKHLNG